MSIKLFPTIAFTMAYQERRQERFLSGLIWDIRPQNLWYEPPLIFLHFRGVLLLEIRWLKRSYAAAYRSEISTFYCVRLSLPLPAILMFLGYCLHFGLAGFRRVRSRVNHMKVSPHVDRFAAYLTEGSRASYGPKRRHSATQLWHATDFLLLIILISP
jgi:hypothetical protein